MKKFILTFGIKYHHETHPRIKNLNADCYYVFEANCYDEAREKIINDIGEYWSFLYEYDEFFKKGHHRYFYGEEEYDELEFKQFGKIKTVKLVDFKKSGSLEGDNLEYEKEIEYGDKTLILKIWHSNEKLVGYYWNIETITDVWLYSAEDFETPEEALKDLKHKYRKFKKYVKGLK